MLRSKHALNFRLAWPFVCIATGCQPAPVLGAPPADAKPAAEPETVALLATVEEPESAPSDESPCATGPGARNDDRVTFTADGSLMRFTRDAVQRFDKAGTPTVRLTFPEGAIFADRTALGDFALLCVNDHVELFDTTSGARKPLAMLGKVSEMHGPPSMSGDGKLVARCRLVDMILRIDVFERVNDTLLATRESLHPPGGFFWAGVSRDSLRATFVSSRGGVIFDSIWGNDTLHVEGWSTPSPDGRWLLRSETGPFGSLRDVDVVVLEGASGRVRGALANAFTTAEHPLNQSVRVAFCDGQDRVVIARSSEVSVHALPSGRIIASRPSDDPIADAAPEVACSGDGKRMAIFHDEVPSISAL